MTVLGHRTGDKLLVEIASQLRAIIGPRGLVTRWGGDEGVILHHHEAGQFETEALAKRIIDEINRAVVVSKGEVIVGAEPLDSYEYYARLPVGGRQL